MKIVTTVVGNRKILEFLKDSVDIIDITKLNKTTRDTVIFHAWHLENKESLAEMYLICKMRIQRNLKTKIIFDSSDEVGISPNDVNNTMDQYLSLGFSFRDILFLCNNAAKLPFEKSTEEVLSLRSKDVQLYFVDYFALDAKYVYTKHPDKFSFLPLNARENKINLLLSKLRTRQNRFVTLYEFYKNNLLEDTVLGLLSSYDDIVKYTSDETFLSSIKHRIKPVTPIYLQDTPEGITTDKFGAASSERTIYDMSVLSYVCEVESLDKRLPGYMISEKTYKAILNKQPFVIQGRPYTLAYLKGLGFKTFDNWVDESYDSLPLDNYENIKAIVITAKSLFQKIPLNDTQIQSVVDFNFSKLMTNAFNEKLRLLMRLAELKKS